MSHAPTTLSWTVHPLVENWRKSVLLGLFLVLLFAYHLSGFPINLCRCPVRYFFNWIAL